MSDKGLAADDAGPAAQARRRSAWVRGLAAAWREPLLHFLLVGALLFGADHFFLARADDPRRIVVTAQVDREARQIFEGARGRQPKADELKALHQNWLDNEVLYREGLALQLDRGDDTIRERVIFKALSVVNAGLKLPAHDEPLLRDWFERNRSRYDDPTRYDFQEAVLSGDGGDAAVQAFVVRLNSGSPGDLDAGLRVFKGRPLSNLQQSYGAAFVSALDSAEPGRWLAVPTGAGQRIVRVERIAPGVPAQFDVLRGVVLQDWTDTVMAEQRTAAVRAMARKYRVQVEAAL